MKQFLIATIAIGVAANLLDGIIHGIFLESTYAAIPSMGAMDTGKAGWFIFGDFVAALVFTWFYGRVHSSFDQNPNGAVLYGIYFGIIVAIPTFMFNALQFKGFPYWLSWVWTIVLVVEFAIYGAILGALTKKKTATA